MVLTGSDYEQLKIGDIAPEFKLPGTDGKSYSLSEMDGKAYLIVFMCNHCPYVIPKIDELKRITADYKDAGLVVVGINPNEDKNYPDDSFENMQAIVKDKDINFLYLRDETQQVAKDYGAVCTPDPFLFDADRKLIFHSRIDEAHGSANSQNKELHTAIGEFLTEGTITVEEKPSMGCSIKWKV